MEAPHTGNPLSGLAGPFPGSARTTWQGGIFLGGEKGQKYFQLPDLSHARLGGTLHLLLHQNGPKARPLMCQMRKVISLVCCTFHLSKHASSQLNNGKLFYNQFMIKQCMNN